MALIEWTDANGNHWQWDEADADSPPTYLPQSPRGLGRNRVAMKTGSAKWTQPSTVVPPRDKAAEHVRGALAPAGDVPATERDVFSAAELAVARRIRQSRLDNGGRWEPLATIILRLRRKDAAHRTAPGVPYTGRTKEMTQ